MTSFIMGKYI